MPHAPFLLQARWVYCGRAEGQSSGELYEDGAVAVVDGRITAVGYASDLAAAAWNAERIDLGSALLVPGLVNAHTHLEFSELSAPLGEPGNAFPDWIRQLVQWRRSQPERSAAEAADQHGVWQGLAESARAGVTLLGEIATPLWPREELCSAYAPPVEPLAPAVEMLAFWELLGLRPERLDDNAQAAVRHLSTEWPAQRLAAGLSPHAPYTVGAELFDWAVASSRARRVPLAFHLAESPEEMQLLADGTGPLVELLKEFAAWDPAAIPHGTRPLDYLQRLAQAERGLVIHGNYLDDEEHGFLAAHRDRLSLIYCPRTHAFFEHPRYPLPKLLARGVRVALGTDSRASNPDLSVLAELRFVAQRFPELAPEKVWQLATVDGAAALGMDGDRGTIAAGKLANLTAVALSEAEIDDPLAEALHIDSPCLATYVHGQRVG